MMDLNTIEMRGRYDTNPAGVASLNDDDGVKSKEVTLMGQMGKNQQLDV